MTTTFVLVHGAWHRLAHSYGGVPVTQGAAGLSTVQQLIYLAAYVPDLGESMFTIHGVPDPEDTASLFPIADDPRSQLYADVPAQVVRGSAGRDQRR